MAEIKVFDKWSTEGIPVNDKGLERYINIRPIVVPKSGGRHTSQKFHKAKMSIVERMITKLMIPGHRNKKHVITSAQVTGQYNSAYNIVLKAFEIIEKKTGKNPVEVLVGAIENSAAREEIAGYQVGGIIVRKAVITSPLRRIDLSLRVFAQTAYRKSFGKKATIQQVLADEITAAYNNDSSKSDAIKDRERVEKEAEGAR